MRNESKIIGVGAGIATSLFMMSVYILLGVGVFIGFAVGVFWVLGLMSIIMHSTR